MDVAIMREYFYRKLENVNRTDKRLKRIEMTIDEAIEYYTNVADQRELADEEKGDYDKWNETRFMTKKQSAQEIADNRQLAAWLKELKELKRLLH